MISKKGAILLAAFKDRNTQFPKTVFRTVLFFSKNALVIIFVVLFCLEDYLLSLFSQHEKREKNKKLNDALMVSRQWIKDGF
jgi:hypothetical protein